MAIKLLIKSACQAIYQKIQIGIEKIQKKIRLKKLFSILFICKMIHSLGPKNLAMHFINFLNLHAKDLYKLTLVTSVLANTGIDERLSQFWQDHIKPLPGVNRILKACKSCGEYGMHLAGALFLVFTLCKKLTTTNSEAEALEKWASHSLFNFASCMLIQGIGCFTLGGARPESNNLSSWRPFLYVKKLILSIPFVKKRLLNDDALALSAKEADQLNSLKGDQGRAISGHALVSAFTTTLCMESIQYLAENKALLLNEPLQKTLIFSTTLGLSALAMGCSLSRVNDRAHYPSQALSGAMLGMIGARQA